MRVVSWNVNGLRACAKRGFLGFLGESKADVVCLQEVRALPEQLPDEVRSPPRWQAKFAPAERLGYSGVAIYSRRPPTKLSVGLGIREFDVEGRFLVAHFGRMSIASVYFPKGDGRNRDNSRVEFKLSFYRAVFERVARLRKSGPTFVTGDFNTAHEEIDLARPASNRKSSGFLPEERAEFSRWIEAGWIDTFRARHRGQTGHYTWWLQWGGARERNVGWRIDYVLASRTADRLVKSAFTWPQTFGSDHCPVGVDLTTPR
ncbi:MAG: exodeoxyribonuclease III [Pseudomonadales bacterium]|nr:exodeoxyribonuclease III [Pseudomonadales bacterium]